MAAQNYDVFSKISNMDYEPIEELDYEPLEGLNNEPIEDLTEDSTGDIDQNDLPANFSKKERFGMQLAGEVPRCPECSKLLKKRTLARCDYCGFSFSYLEKLLPTDQLPPLETLLDFSNKLESDEKKSILEAISFIQKRYPQITPKVCLLPLQSDIEVQQMALWMINQCPLMNGETLEDKQWYLLLLIDTSVSKCCLAYGYQAETFIPDESSWKLVSRLNKSLKKDNVGSHIVELLNAVVPMLDGTKKMLKREYKRFKQKY